MSLLLEFIVNQWFKRQPYPQADHSGQTIIVTGANVGLGLEAARHFVRLNAEKVILGVRNLDKGQAAKESIEQTQGRTGVVEVWQLDLASYESVMTFAHRVQGLKRLDAVVENAGIATFKFSLMEEDESTITVNVVSTFLLGLLLLPKLRESGSRFNFTPHLTIVSSEVHGWTAFEEQDAPDIFRTLSDEKTANMAERYPMSKLLEVFYCRELAERTKKSGKPDVILNYLTPGLCHSELSRDAGWGFFIMKLVLARSAEHGSRALVYAAGAGPETHGQYIRNCTVHQPDSKVTDDRGIKAQKKVWDQLSEKLGKIQPGIMNNV